jgi:neutral ceramidase
MLPDGSTVKTCSPAMGHSFAAGTTDGPGPGVAYQGDNSTDKSWRLVTSVLNVVRDILAKPSSEITACHYPKPILINTGSMRWPYLWQPNVVSIQLFVIGRNFVLVGVPG